MTLGTESLKYSINKDFVGAPMAWSSYSANYNKKLIRNAGFTILMAIEDYRDEAYLWILAKKK